MATKVHMEALSPTMEEGQLVRWLKADGDTIREGDVLAEIETDKATMELVARGSGVLSGISLKEGQTAAVGTVIAMIGAAGEAAASPAPAAAPSAAPAAAEAPKAAAGSGAAGTAAQSREPGVGGSEASGRPEDQEKLTPAAEGTGSASDAMAATPSEARGTAAAPAPTPAAGAEGARVKASPLARRLAEEAGVSLSGVTGTGPGGRITKRDILGATAGSGPADVAGTASTAGPADTAGGSGAGAGVGAGVGAGSGVGAGAGVSVASADAEEVPLTQMRKTIAKRLAQSIGPIPTFYLTIECDMTRLMELRERTNRQLEKAGIKTSVNDFLIKSIAAALARHPEVNASWGDAAITRHHRVHIGVAVAVEDGLITPIVRDADRKRVRDIAGEVKELAARAREKKLKPEEYTGATFSISNLGMFGIVEFTAIINPPESAIIAIGAVEEKVVVENGEMVVRPRMRMTMSCDHRVIDGATGAKFLATVREFVEDPVAMLA